MGNFIISKKTMRSSYRGTSGLRRSYNAGANAVYTGNTIGTASRVTGGQQYYTSTAQPVQYSTQQYVSQAVPVQSVVQPRTSYVQAAPVQYVEQPRTSYVQAAPV